MTKGLHRYYGTSDLHFITCSCYHRKPQLSTPNRRNLFLRILEEARQKYRFVVHGYVVMPEHFHLRITEPEEGDPLSNNESRKREVYKEAASQGCHACGHPLSPPFLILIIEDAPLLSRLLRQGGDFDLHMS